MPTLQRWLRQSASRPAFYQQPTKRGSRLALLALCTPLVLLAGCPGDPLDGTAGAPPHGNPKANAPALTEPSAAAPRPASANAAQPATRPAVQQPTPAEAQANSAHVQQLIANAETTYNSGVKNYRAGHLDAARLDFDYAVDTLLSSGMDLKSEGPLADEFDRLINNINSLELLALKQGNGFSPKLDEAPLSDVADVTFPSDPALVARLKTELNTTSDLPLVINDQVAGYIGVFSNSQRFREHMAASLQRVGKYRGLMQRVLKEEGVPQDLIYLAVAESGFQPQVVNTRSGAGGMWQFMTYTGPQYGLIRNGYFDYRFDPEKSTRAYARYIKALYNQFGDWYLAMAAYDWGPLYVQRAVQRTGYADYWELYRRGAMPAETRAYVPQILAAVIMAKNPERYGLDKLVPSPPVIYDTVTTNYSIDLHLVADVTNSSLAELVALNPAMLRYKTPPDVSFDLHLPPGTKALYNDRLKDIPDDRRAFWRFHVVKPGETLAGIASSLHASEAEIAETNGITATSPMAVDDELVVPVDAPASVPHPQRYTVRRGDTLVTVADRFNISVDELRRWNGLKQTALKPGRTVYVAEPIRLGPGARGRSRSGGKGARDRNGRASARGAAHGSRAAASRAAGGRAGSSSHAASGKSTHASGRSTHAAASTKKRRASH